MVGVVVVDAVVVVDTVVVVDFVVVWSGGCVGSVGGFVGMVDVEPIGGFVGMVEIVVNVGGCVESVGTARTESTAADGGPREIFFAISLTFISVLASE